MANAARILAAILASAAAVAACRPSAPQTAASAADQAAGAAGKIAILIRDVQPDMFDSGAPTQCTVRYDVYNNTNRHLYKAHAAFGGYSINLGEITANTADKDQDSSVDPVGKSCAGVVENMIQNISHLAVTECSLETTQEGDCQSKVVAFIALDRSGEAKVQQAEQAQAQAYAAQQAKDFEQAKAQQWAQRGQFEAPVSTAFSPSDSAGAITVDAVLAPDFDPTKIDENTPISTSSASFCPSTSDALNPEAPGRLVIAAIYTDQYGLAVWYKMQMLCSGEGPKVLWVKASTIDALRQSGQLVIHTAS